MFVSLGPEALAESRTFNTQLEALIARAPSTHLVPPEVTRAARAAGTGIFPAPVVVDEGVSRTIAGDVVVRTFVPPGGAHAVAGVYLHLHGGGWVLGSAFHQDVALWRLARAANVAVVSVDYRLAPEHPWPAGADDCEAAALWLIEHAAVEFGSSRLVIGGESAGAHLAVVTLLRLRDRHGLGDAFAGANLVYGCYDLGMTPSMLRWGDRNLVLSTPIVDWFADCVLPGRSREERRDPEYSPLWADLQSMPPALFTVGTLDPLLDDSLFMAARWAAAGNHADLRVYPEAIHGFTAFPLEVARVANAAQDDSLRIFVR